MYFVETCQTQDGSWLECDGTFEHEINAQLLAQVMSKHNVTLTRVNSDETLRGVGNPNTMPGRVYGDLEFFMKLSKGVTPQ